MKRFLNLNIKTLVLSTVAVLQTTSWAASPPRFGNLTTNAPAAAPTGPLTSDPTNLTGFKKTTRAYLAVQPINPVEHPREGLPVIGNDSDAFTPPGANDSNPQQQDRPLYINIAVGSEALAWLEKAYATMLEAKKNKLPDGRTFYVNLEGKGSINAASAIVESAKARFQGKTQNSHYTVWVPAASVYKTLVSDHFRSSPF